MNLVKEVAGILLGKQGHGTFKAYMVRGTVGTFVLKVVDTILAFGIGLLPARTARTTGEGCLPLRNELPYNHPQGGL